MTETFPTITDTGVDPLLAACRLTIDLDALSANFRTMAGLSGRAEAAAVVKADAYGLGMAQVVPALTAAGCETFFVARVEEGIALRRLTPKAEIFVIGGLADAHSAAVVAEAGLIPVLNAPREVALWAGHWQQRGSRRPCAIHVDTGMNRHGLTVDEAFAFADENDASHAVTPILLMSHLACADEPHHPKNREQLESFQRVRERFEGIDSSLANSAGVFLGADYHFDITRPGVALYGDAGAPGHEDDIRPVVTAEAKILQIRHAKAGETVSYGATVTLKRDTVIAVAAAGYADGFHRAGSGSGVSLRKGSTPGGQGFIAGSKVPILGRVTMDATMFDVTDLSPDHVKVGDHIELFGQNILLQDAASAAGTISYELLTGLGHRYHRRYLGGPRK